MFQVHFWMMGVLFVVFLLGPVSAIQDYCSINNYPSNETYMRFSKEPNFQEFAMEGKFKALHCCAKGYRSIEWFKDGKPYPWYTQLILYPESANQTVYTQAVTETDAGNYTCLLRNDSIVRTHTIQLRVLDKIPDDPKITYISQDTQVPVGHSLRLFCEAFAGRVDLPDAHNEAVWRKTDYKGSLDDHPRIKQKKSFREDGQTFGTYLIIDNVKPEDYGEYICRISKPGKSIEQQVRVEEKIEVVYLNPNPVPVAKLLLFLSAIIFLCLVVVILNLQYGLPLRVRLKDQFGAVEENDGKLNDVLILYSQKDTEVVLGLLQPTLESSYNYKCAARELNPNWSYWFGDLQGDALNSRRILTVISPSTFMDKWDSTTVYQALKQLQNLGPKNLLVTLKALPVTDQETKNSQGETLASVARSLNVVLWERARDAKFWLALRLRLPPKRGNDKIVANNRSVLTQGGNSARLTSDSEESLENFV